MAPITPRSCNNNTTDSDINLKYPGSPKTLELTSRNHGNCHVNPLHNVALIMTSSQGWPLNHPDFTEPHGNAITYTYLSFFSLTCCPLYKWGASPAPVFQISSALLSKRTWNFKGKQEQQSLPTAALSIAETLMIHGIKCRLPFEDTGAFRAGSMCNLSPGTTVSQ